MERAGTSDFERGAMCIEKSTDLPDWPFRPGLSPESNSLEACFHNQIELFARLNILHKMPTWQLLRSVFGKTTTTPKPLLSVRSRRAAAESSLQSERRTHACSD
jgi:hypothetical protein